MAREARNQVLLFRRKCWVCPIGAGSVFNGGEGTLCAVARGLGARMI